MRTDLIEEIAALFAVHGRQAYEGARRESVTALEHALQCAQLAEWAHAEATLVTAALLHDVGHFVGAAMDERVDDRHEVRAQAWLKRGFGPAVTEPVRLHVAAKRYLVTVDPAYAATLSSASIHSLALQGGPMSDRERSAFDREPFGREAVMLRRWDDLAKVPGRPTPPLAHFLAGIDPHPPGH